MNLPTAQADEVYAAREMIDFGNGRQEVIVIYPKNKLIPRWLADEAILKLKVIKEKRKGDKMGFSRDEGKPTRIKKCRTYYPQCTRCLKPIWKGEYFVETCGSKITYCGVAHYNCNTPFSAPPNKERKYIY